MSKLSIELLNGPPQSGKDLIANLIKQKLEPEKKVVILKFTGLMDKVAKLVLNLSDQDYPEWREQKKDDQLFYFENTTMRKFLIGMSEDWIKPHLGVGIMGYHAALEVIRLRDSHFSQSDKDLVIVFSDSGFQEEFDYFKKTLELAEYKPYMDVKINLFNVHRSGGFTFLGDSREWVADEGSEPIFNNDSKEFLSATIDELIFKGKLGGAI